MDIIIAVAAFLLMLFILVVVHELGHFLTAVWMGIRVEEFGVGFPPRAAVLFEHKGVKYTLNWLPLGGFVRFATDERDPNSSRDALYGAGGSLATASPWRKILVMFAGPFMNLLLAILIYSAIFAFNGIPRQTGTLLIGQVFAGTPAAQADLQAGDQLLRVNGQLANNLDVVPQTAQANPGQPVELLVLRGGEELTLTVIPGPWSSPDGVFYDVGFGFSYGPNVEIEAANPLAAVSAGVTTSFDILNQMFRSLASIPGAIATMFSPQSNGEGPIGPVGIARATGEVIQQEQGLLGFWNLTALLSLNLFLLNLLPIPALDGSHIIFSIVELLRGGKRVPPEKEAIVHAIGFVALMTLMLVVTVNDVLRAISGTPVLGN